VNAVLRPLQARIRGQLVVYRTVSDQEVRNRRLSPPLIFYNSVYNSNLQLRDITTTTTTTTDYRGRSAYHAHYYYRRAEVIFAFRAKNFEKYHFKNC
jgi:hypothetical protein